MGTKIKAPPGNGHVHHWFLAPAERGISLGNCSCGEERYYADDMEEETIARVALLNKAKARVKAEHPWRELWQFAGSNIKKGLGPS